MPSQTMYLPDFKARKMGKLYDFGNSWPRHDTVFLDFLIGHQEGDKIVQSLSTRYRVRTPGYQA